MANRDEAKLRLVDNMSINYGLTRIVHISIYVQNFHGPKDIRMASRFTIYSINQISDLIYQISYIIYKISDILDILYK